MKISAGRFTMAVAGALLFAWIAWGQFRSCSRITQCVEHTARAEFTGQTKTDAYGQCLYGLYTHPYMDKNGRLLKHNFWATCDCRR